MCKYMMMDIDLSDVELPSNILKFGYGINYKYIGKVSHSFDRFYVVMLQPRQKRDKSPMANAATQQPCQGYDAEEGIIPQWQGKLGL